MIQFQILAGQDIFLLSISSELVVGPMQLFFQWLPEAVSPGVNRPGHEADTCLHLSLRLRISGAVPVIPIYVFPHGWGQSYLYSLFCLTSLYFVS